MMNPIKVIYLKSVNDRFYQDNEKIIKNVYSIIVMRLIMVIGFIVFINSINMFDPIHLQNRFYHCYEFHQGL